MKSEQPPYNPNPMSNREMYICLAKAAGIYAFTFGLLYFGYSDKWALPIVIIAISCAIWGGTYVAKACSGLYDNRLH